MALYVIGGVVFDLVPLNAGEVDHETSADFARHPVIGGRQTYEHVGPGDEKLRLEGKVFPRKFGGEAELELIDSLRAEAQSILVMRGDGAKLGWFVITEFRRKHEHLDRRGVGQLIEYRIDLERSEKPPRSSAASLLTRLFGAA